uniref:Uncharacterized protein n=1 Tax=Arion vulgaris TaxID=1028688 RepID=A0A0B6ZNY7_9EUPU
MRIEIKAVTAALFWLSKTPFIGADFVSAPKGSKWYEWMMSLEVSTSSDLRGSAVLSMRVFAVVRSVSGMHQQH